MLIEKKEITVVSNVTRINLERQRPSERYEYLNKRRELENRLPVEYPLESCGSNPFSFFPSFKNLKRCLLIPFTTKQNKAKISK